MSCSITFIILVNCPVGLKEDLQYVCSWTLQTKLSGALTIQRNAICKITNILLEYYAIIDREHAETVSYYYSISSFILYTNVTSLSCKLLDQQTDFVYKNKNIYNLIIKKLLTIINGFNHQSSPRGIKSVKFYLKMPKKHAFQDFFTAKFGRVIEKELLLQIDKIAESSGDLTCSISAFLGANF